MSPGRAWRSSTELVSPFLIAAVRKHPIWTEAGEHSLRTLCARSEDRHLPPGQVVLKTGERAAHIYLLLQGAVRVFYPATDQSAEVTVKLFKAPATFGEAESVVRSTWNETVETLSEARVLVTPAPLYFRLMQVEPAVCFRQYWDVCQRFAVAIQTERAANFDDLRDRVIALLIAYANHFGEPYEGQGGVRIAYKLSQDDIARQIGSNRRSIVRALSELYKAELVLRSGRQFVLPNPEALLKEASSGSPGLAFKTDETPWASEKH